ncbi:monovalent cation/H+ antiporter subunit D [Marinobacterium sediminicola]|uniref:Multisubunit potassium/proton antiporter, PhaD subunit (TC 2.A.63.1.1) n=1 Tax=Marinobacterium sediminicola TaxID=518898 RepID=A0ABY1RY68_9GAMM|nr:monovalent cation/H+ antiporter subunit D [Marinobacterium sediminicola]ULG68728.1 monovalent cation/H+ antiporter subunit D [Marinobacterium sediminicola]SMR73254.1 multisubunit potassium/proton antiporter, PhaD subunit (TC 2.A.63.1.1) [Marinobacterium sediminicola]
MSEHLTILPILLPLIGGLLLLLPPLATTLERQRLGALVVAALTLLSAVLLLQQSQTEGIQLYVLGNWQPPYGIVLVADRLSTLLVMLTSLLGLASLLYACAGDDRTGAYFHPLVLLQVMGINGAFLTGDIFNLFVFFEVLLIASYALLIHGGGKQKTQAGFHYVALNLLGSSLFLFALGILYGTLGTLNIADMSTKVAALSEGEKVLAKAGGLLLLAVFGLKAAMLPLHFWLTRTYASASAPVAALFAIMTKVGIYSIYRVHTVIFGANAGDLAFMAQPWIWPLALLTLLAGSIGALASPNLRELTANLVIVSVGTLLISVALMNQQATAAGLYYLVHSTLVCAALFMIADLISHQRGKAGDRFVMSRKVRQPFLLGIMFFVAALTVAGIPPFSGFVGKVMLLQAAQSGTEMFWAWPGILLSSLIAIIALSRGGTTLFWRRSSDKSQSEPASRWHIAAVALLLLGAPLMVVLGGPITDYTAAAAEQLHQVPESLHLLLPGGES